MVEVRLRTLGLSFWDEDACGKWRCARMARIDSRMCGLGRPVPLEFSDFRVFGAF